MGGGGREHALAWRLSQSPLLGTLYTSHPENPGLATLAQPVDVPVDVREAYRLVQFCEKKNIGLVVIGPEEPLAEGFADKLRTPERLVFGPNRDGAQLEADKAFSKDLMRAAAIPTAEARTFRDPEGAREFVESRCAEDIAVRSTIEGGRRLRDPVIRRQAVEALVRMGKALIAQQPIDAPDLTLVRSTEILGEGVRDAGVIQSRCISIAKAWTAPREGLPVVKAAGLAKGKGVILPKSLDEATTAINDIMVRRVFGDAGQQLLLEDRLSGPEVSVMALVDGRNIYVLETAQDHKRLGDNDTGPNTGGMGAFCPSPRVDEAMMRRIEREILVPTMDAVKREGIDYRGVIYAGLMLTHAGPKVLEYNCRFGDPECQAIMARLESDLLEVMLATCRGRLHEVELRWTPGASCCVVMASGGYPEKPRTGLAISGLDEAAQIEGVQVFHAGTKRDGDRIVTTGGRVLGVTGVGEDLDEARRRAYAAVDHIRFDGAQVRRDIGQLAVKRR